MKLRDLLTGEDNYEQDYKFINGRFVIVGTYSLKTRYDSEKDDEKVLNKYLDYEVFKIEANDIFTEIGHYALVIYIEDYYLTLEEKRKLNTDMNQDCYLCR